MGRFNLDDYATVEMRLPVFWDKHPNGRIETRFVRTSDDFQSVVILAELYREGEERPFSTGMAEEHQGGNGPNKDCWIENCETSAIGRALANAGWQGSIGAGNAPRPSREEMEKVNRGAQSSPPQNAPSTPPAASLGKPEGYRFDMGERPTYKSGAHVFSKGPKRAAWDGWTWDDMARCHYDQLRSGLANVDNDPITNMIASEFINGWNREQAEVIHRDQDAAAKAATPVLDGPSDHDMSIPF